MGEGFKNVQNFHAKLNLLPLCAVSQFKSFYYKVNHLFADLYVKSKLLYHVKTFLIGNVVIYFSHD